MEHLILEFLLKGCLQYLKMDTEWNVQLTVLIICEFDTYLFRDLKLRNHSYRTIKLSTNYVTWSSDTVRTACYRIYGALWDNPNNLPCIWNSLFLKSEQLIKPFIVLAVGPALGVYPREVSILLQDRDLVTWLLITVMSWFHYCLILMIFYEILFIMSFYLLL